MGRRERTEGCDVICCQFDVHDDVTILRIYMSIKSGGSCSCCESCLHVRTDSILLRDDMQPVSVWIDRRRPHGPRAGMLFLAAQMAKPKLAPLLADAKGGQEATCVSHALGILSKDRGPSQPSLVTSRDRPVTFHQDQDPQAHLHHYAYIMFTPSRHVFNQTQGRRPQISPTTQADLQSSTTQISSSS